MQQLDDLEIWKVPQEPPSEETMRDVDEGTQSPDSPEKVDGPAQLPPEDLLGSEHSPEEAEATVPPVPVEKEDRRPPQGASEATAAANPAGHGLDASQAPASRQRKWAMEEIVIRDHLGQEVGCMDAVGQTQISLEKEEELEDQTNSEDRCDRWSQPGPADGALGQGPLDCELASRDGPEGASPPAQDHQSPSGILPPEDSHSTGPGDGPPEGGSLAPEAGGRGVGQEVGPEQKVQEMEPAPVLTATGDEAVPEPGQQSQRRPMETPVGQEAGAVETWPVPQRPGSPPEQLTASLPHPFPPGQEVKDPSAQEEAKISCGDPVRPSPPTQSQDPEPPLQGTKGSLLGQIPPEDNKGSLLDPELPFLPDPSPPPSLPESAGSLFDPATSAMQQAPLPDEEPPSQQDPLASSLERKASHPQGEAPPLPGEQGSPEDQVPPAVSSLPAADMALPSPGTQEQPLPPLPKDQPLSGPACLPSSEPEGEGPFRDNPRPSTDQLPPLTGQRGSLLGTEGEAAEEPPGGLLQGSMPTPTEHPADPPPSQTPPPEGEAGQSLPDQTPPVLQDVESGPVPGWTPASSLPGGGGDLPGERQGPLPSQVPQHLPEEAGSSPAPGAPPTSEDQAMATPLGEAPASLPEVAKTLPEGQNSPAPPEERPPLAGQPSPPGSAPPPVLPGTPVGPHALPLSSQEPPQPLLDKPCARGSGDASTASAGAGAGAGEVAAEVLGNLHAEKQHLQKEAEGSGGTPAKPGVLKSPGATSNPTPNDSSPRSSANTAHPPQLQAAPARQGHGPEPERGKHKSCQCCALM
ncbi:uncharacterized protein LOC143833756 [Paroedura picta]|uniref:uncharacterized protein LOC143833756 n=1 Tax=Paroedura picta TaxID=143630 RepID=UPI004057B177